MNFTDPSIISQGSTKDKFYLTVKQPEWFITENGQALDSTFVNLVGIVPKQVPKGIVAESVES